MMKKITILALTVFAASVSNAQHEFEDYIVKKGDTIYGVIKEKAPGKLYLERDGNKAIGQSPIVTIRNAQTIRFNDLIYLADDNEDPIYASSKPRNESSISIKKFGNFTSVQPELQDFVVLNNNDTIYGKIEGRDDLRLVSDKATHQINSEVKAYRYRNNLFVRSTSAELPFLKLLVDGKAKLFEYRPQQSDYNRIYLDGYKTNNVVYYVQKGQELLQITPSNFPDAAIQAFADNHELVNLIKNRVYGFSNMYLITKYYNSK
ncbi:MAG TPA: hypothetical protein VGB44_07675 [Flavobacterium sp.]